MMDETLGDIPINELSDWPAPPPASATEARADVSPQRIYLPGNECLAQVVSGTIPAPTTTQAKGRNTTTVPVVPNNTVVVNLVEPPALPVVKQYIKDRYPAGPVHTVPIGAYWVYNCTDGLPPSAVTTVAG
jgi:hypothetical protein